MLSINRILFPTDLSEGAARAFAQATHLAEWHDADLHILNVTGRHRHDYEDAKARFPLSTDALGEWLAPAEAGPDADSWPDLEALSHTQVQVEGAVPAERICDYAETEDIDLIVMGTHGRRGVDRMLFGSVTEEVVREAHCPTFTVRTEGDAAPSQAVRRVLAPVDFSDASEAAVRHAREVALTYGAEIDLLHVVEEPFYPSAYGYDPSTFPTAEVLDNVEAQLGDMARDMVGYEHAMVEARTGDPAREILAYTEEKAVDLIVIATHGRTGLDRVLMGSVAERVLRRAPTPVFIVTPDRKSLLPAPAAEAHAHE